MKPSLQVSITRSFSFESAHSLPDHNGKCQYLHGHTYQLEVTVARKKLIEGGSSDGMVLDFGDLKPIVNDLIIEPLDHRHLNEVLPYRPTAENMVVDFFERLSPIISDLGGDLIRIRLWETPDSYAEVSFP